MFMFVFVTYGNDGSFDGDDVELKEGGTMFRNVTERHSDS